MTPTSTPGRLIRTVGLGAATLLVVSSVIGSGVYKKVAPMAEGLGSPLLVLLCWVLAGLITLFGALSNAEVAGMLANSGGEYSYFKHIYGRFMAFLYGWSIFAVIKSAAVASIAYVFAQSLHAIVPLPQGPPSLEAVSVFEVFHPFQNLGVKLVTIALILGLTFVNTRGVKLGSLLSGWVTKAMMLGLAGVVISGLLSDGGSLSNLASPASAVPKAGGFALLTGMFGALLAAFWAYEGWNIVGYLGGEIEEPHRNIPRALFGGTALVLVVYLLVNATYMVVLPVDRIIALARSQNEIAAVAVLRHIAGNPGAIALSVLILLTTFGCTNTTILSPPRVYCAMADDGLFWKGAAIIHPRFHTPSRALWIQAVWSSLLVLSGSFDQLTDMLVFAAFFFYGATTLGVFILRRREPLRERPYRVWGYPFVPALFIAFCASLVVVTFFARPREAVLGVVLMATGIPFYAHWNRAGRGTPPTPTDRPA